MTKELSTYQTLEKRVRELEKQCSQWHLYFTQIETKLKQLSDKQKNIQALYDYMSDVSEQIKKNDKLNQGGLILNRIDTDDKDA